MASYLSLKGAGVLLLVVSLNLWAASPAQVNIDNELGRTISATYKHLAKAAQQPTHLTEALRRAESAYAAKDYAAALQTLAQHRVLDISRSGDAALQGGVRLALQLYCHTQVEKLLEEAQQQGDTFFEAKLSFELARFFAANEHWPAVIASLKDDSLLEQLTKEEMAEALVLLGTALQKQKKHREAIRLYEKVGTDSGHFKIAQLNLASALLRQEWWTDAHTAINAALGQNKTKRSELDYRLYTMKGFSQIQFGFYRDARESFRNVAVASQYAQRALLGLGISALHQQDFIGALNAFDKLRAQQKYDISIAEAHLLSAFTLRQLEQFDAATNRYQEAIDYYQQLSKDIDALLNSTSKMSLTFLRPEHNNDKLLRNNAQKSAMLDALSAVASTGSQAATFATLKNKISSESALRAGHLLREEKNAIDSYLSQARFGLASLYDQK